MTTVYCAECDQFDNSRTGYYATDAAAIDAFWTENHFSAAERSRACVYARQVEVTDDLIADAILLDKDGSPSPALAAEIEAVQLAN